MNDIIAIKDNWKSSAHITESLYHDMYTNSINNPEKFWKKYAQQIDWITPFSDQCIKKINFSKENLEIKWFYDGELNVSYNCLDRHLTENANKTGIPCFGVLGDLILNFSKILNQKATHKPSGQHILNDEYYKRIEAIQFTMNHDDGNQTDNVLESDIILIGVSRTSKTPTSIYLANKGLKTANIPLVNEMKIPKDVVESKNLCVVGLVTEAERLFDIRKNRLTSLKENENTEYIDLDKIRLEVENSKKIFKKNQWPTIDVTRKSVEETAASIIKIYEIMNK